MDFPEQFDVIVIGGGHAAKPRAANYANYDSLLSEESRRARQVEMEAEKQTVLLELERLKQAGVQLTRDFNKWYADCQVCRQYRSKAVPPPLHEVDGCTGADPRLGERPLEFCLSKPLRSLASNGTVPFSIRLR